MESLELAARYGLPTVLLAALSWGIWRSCGAAWRDIVLPARDRGFLLIDKLERSIDSFSDNLDQQTSSLKNIETQAADTARNLAELRRQCEIRCIGGAMANNHEMNGDGA